MHPSMYHRVLEGIFPLLFGLCFILLHKWIAECTVKWHPAPKRHYEISFLVGGVLAVAFGLLVILDMI
jgi:hypothetical protein